MGSGLTELQLSLMFRKLSFIQTTYLHFWSYLWTCGGGLPKYAYFLFT